MEHDSSDKPRSSSQHESADAESSKNFGHFLKRERLSQHLTLEEVSEATRINITALEALEAGDQNRLPARVFVQGFIKLYAKHLGIDPLHALDLYTHNCKDKYSDTMSRLNVQEILASETMAELPSVMSGRQVLLIILFILLGVLGYVGYRTYSSMPPLTVSRTVAPEQSAPQPDPAAAHQEEQPAVEDGGEQPEAAAPALHQPEETADRAEATAIQYTLKAQFTEKTWIWVQTDDQPMREFTFQAGEASSWEAREKIALHIGNAGGVRLTLNDKQLPALGRSGQTVRMTIPDTLAQ